MSRDPPAGVACALPSDACSGVFVGFVSAHDEVRFSIGLLALNGGVFVRHPGKPLITGALAVSRETTTETFLARGAYPHRQAQVGRKRLA
jgi:hypothetical protein